MVKRKSGCIARVIVMPSVTVRKLNRSELARELVLTREHTLSLLQSLTPEQWAVPLLDSINPPLWELGHLAWFQEYWCCRWRDAQPLNKSILLNADTWYDSNTVSHATRWQLDLPNLKLTNQYLSDTLQASLEKLSRTADSDDGLYNFRLALFHEKMHAEAFTYTWQYLGYPATQNIRQPDETVVSPDIAFADSVLNMGSNQNDGFVFDNEKWAHPVTVPAFEISSSPVMNSEYAAFVFEGGYSQQQYWDPDYFQMLKATGRTMPSYWEKKAGRVTERWFDSRIPIQGERPVMHISAFEAQAYCMWAKRSLPTEAQWEVAALNSTEFNWGRSIWEWTASAFESYPGFEADRYKEYSAPWFGDHRVCKGSSFATPAGLAHAKFRNFFKPMRHDIFVGFRTCAI
jgi:gamma-glutamyl hercynylcysteine S-oxide synthase